MLRRILFATALLAATLSSGAHSSDYIKGRVVSVAPHLSLAFGSLRHDGFRVEYEFGGHHYSTVSPRHPGRVILVPPPHRVRHAPPHWQNGARHWRHDHRRWNDHDDWDDRRHWRDNDDRGRGRGHHHGRH